MVEYQRGLDTSTEYIMHGLPERRAAAEPRGRDRAKAAGVFQLFACSETVFFTGQNFHTGSATVVDLLHKIHNCVLRREKSRKTYLGKSRDNAT